MSTDSARRFEQMLKLQQLVERIEQFTEHIDDDAKEACQGWLQDMEAYDAAAPGVLRIRLSDIGADLPLTPFVDDLAAEKGEDTAEQHDLDQRREGWAAWFEAAAAKLRGGKGA